MFYSRQLYFTYTNCYIILRQNIMDIQQEIVKTPTVSTSNVTDFSKNFYHLRSTNEPSTFTKNITSKVETKINNSPLIYKINKTAQKQREFETRLLWRKADAVCFDVDSTVCRNEAIDDFAEFLGVSDEVAKCTRNAMGGEMTFREALEQRLDLMKPSKTDLNNYLSSHSVQMTPGIIDLIAELKHRNIDVYLVSGGFRSIIKPVAKLLSIDYNNIYANKILFDKNGNYAGFDKKELTSDSGSKQVGKAGVCAQLKAKYNYKTLIMIGDGATDAEASPPADAFIGFGGNQIRDTVRKLSDWYVYDFATLNDELSKRN